MEVHRQHSRLKGGDALGQKGPRHARQHVAAAALGHAGVAGGVHGAAAVRGGDHRGGPLQRHHGAGFLGLLPGGAQPVGLDFRDGVIAQPGHLPGVRGEHQGDFQPLQIPRVAAEEVDGVSVGHQGPLAVGEHQRAHQLRPLPQAAAHDAGGALAQGVQQRLLALLPAVFPVQHHVHRLGHRLGQDGVQPLLHGDGQQSHAAAQGRLGRHNAGPGHAPAAAHQQQLAHVALVGLGVRLGQPLPGEEAVRLKDPGLRPLHQGGGDAHLAHHRLPAELLGGVADVGGLLPGEGHGDVRPEGPGGHPARVALHAAGQVGGDFQAGQAAAIGQQLLGQAGELPPEAEPKHAVDEHVRGFQHRADLLQLLPGQDSHLGGQRPKGRSGQVGGGLALGQHHPAGHAPLGQQLGADKAVPAVVALSAQHHRPLAPHRAAAALHLLGHGGAGVVHQLGEGHPGSHGGHLQALHFITAKKLHTTSSLTKGCSLY